MLDTAILLTRSPKRALVDIINYHNNLLLETDKVSISNPVIVNGRKTRITVTSIPAPNSLYTGQADFTFNRLDLTQFFAPVVLNMELFYPSTTSSILQKLSQQFGMVMNESDFIIEELLTQGTSVYRLKAASSSLRWVGGVDINVTLSINLQDHLEVDFLNGLTGFANATPLQNLYQIVVLNGLTYGDFSINLQGVFLRDTLDGHWYDDDGIVYNPSLTLTPTQALRALVNEVTVNPLNSSDYSLGSPAAETGDRNTSIVLTATGLTTYTGSKTVRYNRIPLSVFFQGQVLQYSTNRFISDQDLWNLLANDFNFAVGPSDYILQALDVDSLPGGIYTLTANPNSLRWVGSVDIELTALIV
jgi:hypothetical protein